MIGVRGENEILRPFTPDIHHMVGVFGSNDVAKGNVTSVYGGEFYTANIDAEGSAVVDAALRVSNGTGTRSQLQYGLLIGELTGAVENYSIKTGSAPNLFSGSTFIRTDSVPGLSLASDGANYFLADGYGGAYIFAGRRAGGTRAVPLVISGPETTMAALAGDGYDGSTFIEAGNIAVALDGIPTTGIVAGQIIMSTRDSTGTYSAKAWLRASGKLGLGIAVPTAKMHIVETDSVTNTISPILRIGHNSTGTPTTNFGAAIDIQLATNSVLNKDAAHIYITRPVATEGSQTSRMTFYMVDNTSSREVLRMETSGTEGLIGVFGVSAKARTSAYTLTYASITRTGSAISSSALGDSFGVGSTTIPSVGATFNTTTLDNIVRSLVDENNNLRTDLLATRQLLNQVIIDFKNYGWLQ
jgi:hypothetical protein